MSATLKKTDKEVRKKMKVALSLYLNTRDGALTSEDILELMIRAFYKGRDQEVLHIKYKN